MPAPVREPAGRRIAAGCPTAPEGRRRGARCRARCTPLLRQRVGAQVEIGQRQRATRKNSVSQTAVDARQEVGTARGAEQAARGAAAEQGAMSGPCRAAPARNRSSPAPARPWFTKSEPGSSRTAFQALWGHSARAARQMATKSAAFSAGTADQPPSMSAWPNSVGGVIRKTQRCRHTGCACHRHVRRRTPAVGHAAAACTARLLRRRGLPGADGPHRLIGHHDLADAMPERVDPPQTGA